MINYISIGRRICYYRKLRRMTQSDFSEKLGVSESYISQVERGITKVSLTRLDLIAEALEIDISLLLSDRVDVKGTVVNPEIFEIINRWPKEQVDLLANILVNTDHYLNNPQKN